jgi:hypothetical protein
MTRACGGKDVGKRGRPTSAGPRDPLLKVCLDHDRPTQQPDVRLPGRAVEGLGTKEKALIIPRSRVRARPPHQRWPSRTVDLQSRLDGEEPVASAHGGANQSHGSDTAAGQTALAVGVVTATNLSAVLC